MLNKIKKTLTATLMILIGGFSKVLGFDWSMMEVQPAYGVPPTKILDTSRLTTWVIIILMPLIFIIGSIVYIKKGNKEILKLISKILIVISVVFLVVLLLFKIYNII